LPSLILVHQAGNVEGPLQALMAGSLVASVFFAPIFFYVFAAFTALFAKFLGGKGTWQSARLALFWSLIAMQPLVLVTQVMAVQLGPNLITQGILMALAAFFTWVWYTGMKVSGWPSNTEAA
ncbi:MAG: phosphoglycerol transferase MdoB-like AlkP superfamily enzyme, partial [Candidatus Paceibacteria bacterium]